MNLNCNVDIVRHEVIYKNAFCVKGKKVKVKLSLCLTKHNTMETYW
jgi:hypothetical protein